MECASDVCDADESEVDEEEALRLGSLDQEWHEVDVVPNEPGLAHFECKSLLGLANG